jgi:hypothetical protein
MEPTTQESSVQKFFEKQAFATPIISYVNNKHDEFKQEFFRLSEKIKDTGFSGDILELEDEPAVILLKEAIFNVCAELKEFGFDNTYPVLSGTQFVYQQPREHIPAHSYEFVPMVLTYIVNEPEEHTPTTYYVDPRGAVQTVREKVSQNLVGTYFGMNAHEGEIIATPGYLTRYTETNLSRGTYLAINVMVNYSSGSATARIKNANAV